MLLKLNWTRIQMLGHLRIKPDCRSDLSDLQTVLCIQKRFHILIIYISLPPVLLCAIRIIIVLHFCSLKLTLLPVLCGDC